MMTKQTKKTWHTHTHAITYKNDNKTKRTFMDKFKEETAKQRISYQTNETAKHGPKRMAYWGTGNIECEIKTKKEKISIRGNNKKSVRPPHYTLQ